MKIPLHRRRLLGMSAVLVPLAALLVYALLRSGPLASVPVTVARVRIESLSPVLFGVGTVEARWRYQIGPTQTGRLASLAVDVGDAVTTGQLLGTMDPVDLDARISAQQNTLLALESAVAMASARLAEAEAHRVYAGNQSERYRGLLVTRAVSDEAAETALRNDRAAEASVTSARAAVVLARNELAAARSNLDALERQKHELALHAPVPGLIVGRNLEPGSTAVAGEAVLEMIDPKNLWIHLRLNQLDAAGLRAGLACRIELRSRPGETFQGRVLRVEPLADAVTEELLAKVVCDQLPAPVPPLGELAEVHVELPAESPMPVLPAAAIHSQHGSTGVWRVVDGKPRFTPVRTGRRSAGGDIQIVSGIPADAGGVVVVVHSERSLKPGSRLKINRPTTTNNQ